MDATTNIFLWILRFATTLSQCRGKHLCQSLFLSSNFIKKETLAQGFSYKFCKIFKNTFFTDHLWITASTLQQLLALYISGNFQVVKSH